MCIHRCQGLTREQHRFTILHSQPLEPVIGLDRAAGIVRGERHVAHFTKLWMDLRLVLKDVKASSEESASLQSFHKCIFTG
jgi:hypothetical protein